MREHTGHGPSSPGTSISRECGSCARRSVTWGLPAACRTLARRLAGMLSPGSSPGLRSQCEGQSWGLTCQGEEGRGGPRGSVRTPSPGVRLVVGCVLWRTPLQPGRACGSVGLSPGCPTPHRSHCVLALGNTPSREGAGSRADGAATFRPQWAVLTTVALEPGAGDGMSRAWNSQTCPSFCSNSPNVSSESDESGAGLRGAMLP